MAEDVVFQLIGAALILGLIAVLLDRINFPQKRFRPKGVAIGTKSGTARDRTGAHIIDLDEDELDDDMA